MRNSDAPITNNQKRTGISLRTQLIIGVMTIVGISLAVVLIFSFTQRQQLSNFVTSLVRLQVDIQAENFLVETVDDAAENANEFFETVSTEVKVTSSFMTSLYNNRASLNSSNYWNAQEELSQFSAGQWGNSRLDPGSILAPSSFELTDETAAKINTTILLDLIAPQALSTNSELKAIYFVNTEGVVQYYPNIDLANIVGDFDARQRPYYKAVIPEHNPERNPFWTVPYYDATDGSIVETHSRPVYDAQGEFKGAVAADVNIDTVTTIVNSIQVGQTGYAFLIDPNGRFIVLPEEALVDFGLGMEALPEGGIAQKTIFDISEDRRPFANQMISGESGVDKLSIDEEEHYIAFAPIETTGYSLGVVVPVNEMIQLYLTVQERTDQQEAQMMLLSVVILIAVLLIAILFAYIVARLITRPLQSLTDAATEVAAGNYDVEVDTSMGGEIGTLALAFDDMASQVNDMVGSLEQLVSNRTRALRASMEVSRSVSTILDPKQLVAEVVKQVRNAFDYYHVHIYVREAGSNDLVIAGGTGKAGQALLDGRHTIAMGTGLIGRAAATQTTVLVSDVSTEEGWISNPLLPDTQAEIAVPMILGNELYGVLDVQQNEAGSLTEIDAQLLESVANQVVIALRNATLFEGAQAQARQEAIENAISQKLQTAADVESVLKIAAEELGKALKTQRTAVQLGHMRHDNHGHK
ncbi:MAG: hypothetical protein CSB13_02310 [Chloroflexi bacterium]|nr:MAG: hypothetical protein CSB13_02310 [Chloroflexota bacterium]